MNNLKITCTYSFVETNTDKIDNYSGLNRNDEEGGLQLMVTGASYATKEASI